MYGDTADVTRESASVLVGKIQPLDFLAVRSGYDRHLGSVAVGSVTGYQERVVFAVVCETLVDHTVRKSGDDKHFFRIPVILAYGKPEISSDSEEQKKYKPDKATKNDENHLESLSPSGYWFFL